MIKSKDYVCVRSNLNFWPSILLLKLINYYYKKYCNCNATAEAKWNERWNKKNEKLKWGYFEVCRKRIIILTKNNGAHNDIQRKIIY